MLQLLYAAVNTSTHRASANNSKQQCCWLSMSIGGSDGTAVKSAAFVAAPFVWRCLLAVAPVCCLGSLCGLTVWYHKLYALVLRTDTYFGLELCSAIVCHFSGVWFRNVRQQ